LKNHKIPQNSINNPQNPERKNKIRKIAESAICKIPQKSAKWRKTPQKSAKFYENSV